MANPTEISTYHCQTLGSDPEACRLEERGERHGAHEGVAQPSVSASRAIPAIFRDLPPQLLNFFSFATRSNAVVALLFGVRGFPK